MSPTLDTARRVPAHRAGAARRALLCLTAAVLVLPMAACSLDAGGPGGASAEPTGTQETSSAVAEAMASVAVAAEDFQTLADYENQTIDWGGCEDFDPPEGGTTDGFECGFIAVPLDYDDPAGEVVTLAVNRRPARRESEGAIVVNPGGPGASGVDFAFFDTRALSAAVVESYDIVGFDPRGVARSEGVDCLDDEALDAYLAVDVSPDSPAEAAAYEARLQDLRDGCAGQAPLAARMSTATVARDLDVLRATLGENALNWMGKSYGTQIGAVYAELFPGRVGRMVLDGSVDPAGQGGPESLIDQVAGFEVALRSFAVDCLARDDCPLTGDADSATAQVAQLVSGLDAEPLPTADSERPLTQGLSIYGVFGPLYNPTLWPFLRDGLRQATDDERGDTLLLLADFYAEREPDGTYRGNALEALSAVTCLDVDPAAAPADNAALQQRMAERAPVLGPLFDVQYDACAQWPFPAVGQPQIGAEGAAPILVIGTTRDPATPYQWSVAMAEALESGVLVTFEGDGHTAYLSEGSGCVDEIVDEYLVAGVVPDEGVRCEANYDD